MDATLKGLVGLVTGSDVETRCAALVVLTRLAAGEPPVARAVAAALASPNVVVRDFALGYFEHVPTAGTIDAMLPLLDAEDETVRRRAVAVLAAAGAAAVTAARKQLADAPRRRVTAILELCAQVRSAAALDTLFHAMESDDLELNRSACDALIAVVPALATRERAEVLRRANALATGARGHRTRLVAAAKLFGALGDASARAPLFAMLDAREPPIVRTHALSALTQCLRGATLTAREIDTLLPLLDGDDEAGVLRPAVRLLEDQTLGRPYLARLNQLAENPVAVVKRFAVGKLGSIESGSVVKTLIGYLTDDSYARRDQAIATLKTLPAARLPLMKELLACDDERKAWTLADIVLLHDRAWKRDTLTALWTALTRALETREDRLYAALHHVLHALAPDWLAEQIRARADALRKRQRFAESARWLALLRDTPAWDDEARYAFAVATLKTHRHPLGTAARPRDPALEVFRGLADSPFPLAERLRKERVLEPEDLYYVAFALADARGEARATAEDVLTHLGETFGRTKVGKAARNKLALLTR